MSKHINKVKVASGISLRKVRPLIVWSHKPDFFQSFIPQHLSSRTSSSRIPNVFSWLYTNDITDDKMHISGTCRQRRLETPKKSLAIYVDDEAYKTAKHAGSLAGQTRKRACWSAHKAATGRAAQTDREVR